MPSKNSSVKLKVSEYLEQILNTGQAIRQANDKNVQKIEALITACLNDPLDQIRKNG